MEQQVGIHFLTLNGLETGAVHIELESVHGPEALARPTVKKWQRRFHQGRTDLFNDSRSGRPLTNDLAGAMGSMVEERLFSSCKMMCHHFRIGEATCLRMLHDKLGLKIFHFRWVPHALLIDQKSERVSYSKFFSF
jgi:hypothetical protein